MKLVTFNNIKNANISPASCLSWVSEAITSKSSALLPAKISLHPGMGDVFCNFMPSIVTDSSGKHWGGVKVVTRYPNREPALNSYLLLFDADTGEMLALMDADWITAMRTGAVATHSINLLAKKDFRKVSIMGLGNTGRSAMLMLLESVQDREIEVKLLAHNGQEKMFIDRFSIYNNVRFSTTSSVNELVKGADVVISAVTYLADDICPDSCFDEGVLVVPIHTRGFTNCDLFFDKVFADDRNHVCHFKNFEKFRQFGEVSDVVNGVIPGRENNRERILAYNIGVSMHDIAFAAKIYEMLDLDDLVDVELEQPNDKFWV